MMVEQGYALVDGAAQPPARLPARERAGTDLVARAVLREVHQRTMNMDLPEDVLAFLFTQLADIECAHTLAACPASAVR